MSSENAVYYDPYKAEITLDPYPVYRRLRQEAPLYYNEQHDFYAVSRYEDVERGLAIDASKHARDWIANLESVEREKTGIKTLKVGYNKVFGYYIEISRGAEEKAPEHYIRKQTLVNAERCITPEMKEYETLVLNAEERIREIELRLFKEVCVTLGKSAFKMLETARALAELDVLSALAEVAALGGYSRPEVHEGSGLEIHEGRHPVVEQTLKSERYIPNDVSCEHGERVDHIAGVVHCRT